MSSPFPVSACAEPTVMTERNVDIISIKRRAGATAELLLIYFK
jgi:hypothetical protein